MIDNELNIALVEGDDLVQYVFVLLAKELGHFQGRGDRLALLKADDLSRGKTGDVVHDEIQVNRHQRGLNLDW